MLISTTSLLSFLTYVDALVVSKGEKLWFLVPHFFWLSVRRWGIFWLYSVYRTEYIAPFSFMPSFMFELEEGQKIQIRDKNVHNVVYLTRDIISEEETTMEAWRKFELIWFHLAISLFSGSSLFYYDLLKPPLPG